MSRVVITGMSLWDSIGYDIKTNLDYLLENQDRHPTVPTYGDLLSFGLADGPPNLEEFKQENFRKIPCPQFNLVAAWTCGQAIRESGLIEDHSRLAVFTGSLFGDAESQLKTVTNYANSRARTGPSDLFYTCNDTLSPTLARIYDIGGMSISTAASCTSGLHIIELAATMIQQGSIDQAVVLAQDFCSNSYNTYRMNGVGAFSATNACRPFDSRRDGTVAGDACAVVILESSDSAKNRDADIKAEILGIGSATQHLHRTNPQSARRCYYDAYNKAIEQSGISPDDISWISGHVTGTRDGDDVENDVMGELLPGRPITSFKGHIGHTMAACGIAELIYTVESGRRQTVPHIGNFESTDLETRLIFADHNIHDPGKVILKNSYGFGGRASSMIFSLG